MALPTRLALVSPGNSRAHLLARLLAGLGTPHGGTVRIGGHDLATIPLTARVRRIAHAGPEPTLFPGTIRDNVLYGLRDAPPSRIGDEEDDARRRLTEARLSGNPIETVRDRWIDFFRTRCGRRGHSRSADPRHPRTPRVGGGPLSVQSRRTGRPAP